MPIPAFKTKGHSPYNFVQKFHTKAKTFYLGKDRAVEDYLRQHPREDDTTFKTRKERCSTSGETKKAVSYLTRTIGNKRHQVRRNLSQIEHISELANVSSRMKSFESTLKRLCKEALLAGLSYCYINSEGDGADVEAIVLDASQVSHILLDEEGRITQCQIEEEILNVKKITQWREGHFQSWQTDNKKEKEPELKQEGDNGLGFAPIIPFIIDGSLDDPESINSVIWEVARHDDDIMNIWSAANSSFANTAFPIYAIPTPAGMLDEGEDDEKENTLEIGSRQAFTFPETSTPPSILEPQHNSMREARETIREIKQTINQIIGRVSPQDNKYEQGRAKEFSFHEINESSRTIHYLLEEFEYNFWYIAFLLSPITDEDRKETDFKTFKSKVTINHPVSFEPSERETADRFQLIFNMPDWDKIADEGKQVIIKEFIQNSLKRVLDEESLGSISNAISFKQTEETNEE